MFSILWKPDAEKNKAFTYDAISLTDLVDKIKFLVKVYDDLKKSGFLKSNYQYTILVENFMTGSWEEWKDEESGITDPLEYINHISKESNKKKRQMRLTPNRNIL